MPVSWGRASAASLALVPLLVLFAYAVLLPGGKWQGDDYLWAWFVGRDGLSVLVDRVTGRSPRPIAEVLTWLYLSVSNTLDRPASGWFLGLLWLAALAGIATAGRAARVERPVWLALVLFALTLLVSKPGEMFYWPQGAAAYVPCWAAMAAATVLHRSAPARGGLALMLALLVAGFSAEVGAMTVLLYAGLAGWVFLRHRERSRMLPLILPAVGGGVVCLMVLHGRMQAMGEVIDAASGRAGNWAASLWAAVPAFGSEAVGIDGLPLAAGVVIKLLLLVCLPPGGLRQPGGSRQPAIAWAGALVLGAFASVVLAYYEFGTLCCERHATLRQAMLLLALATIAGLMGSGFDLLRRTGLAALMIALVAVRAPAIVADWRTLPEVIATRKRNWEAVTGGDAMTLQLMPAGAITNSDALPAGHYRRTTDERLGDTRRYAWGVMARFGKHTLTIAPASR